MSQIIEGTIQGVTEFLPISSSGHIVLLEQISGFAPENLAQLQIALHLGTLFSIMIFSKLAYTCIHKANSISKKPTIMHH